MADHNEQDGRALALIGGWTEPKGQAPPPGALLLGQYGAGGALVHVASVPVPEDRELRGALMGGLRRRARKTPPFDAAPAERAAHWVTPRVAVELAHQGWDAGGMLKDARLLGPRSDVGHEQVRYAGPPRLPEPEPLRLDRHARTLRALERLEQEQDGDDGAVPVEDGTLEVTSLRKPYFPAAERTKGDLLRYYAAVAPAVLPCMEGRPLVLKRHPNGVRGPWFYQHEAPDEVPAGVRVETVPTAEGGPQRRLIGGSLATLLYTAQLGAVSYEPWHARVGSLDQPDYLVLDLDPGPGAGFRTAVEVARRLGELLDRLGLSAALKTSGSEGLHIYLPLEPETSWNTAADAAEALALRVAEAHPRIATVERMKKKRPRGTVYVDHLQNSAGKTVSGAYSVRAKTGATVSAPLTWDELDDDLEIGDFTLDTVLQRLRERGDPWGPAMRRTNPADRLPGLARG